MGTPEPYKDSFLDDAKPPPGFFDSFRIVPFPTLYPSIKTAVTSDVLLAGFIFAAVILAFSLLLIVPGVRRWNRRLTTIIRIVVAVSFCVFIMLCNFGQNWEVGYLSGVRTQYKALLTTEINASIGVNIGLRSVNITLKGEPRIQHFEAERQNETIDYNERLSWDSRGWLLNRAFFGPYAGRFNQEFRADQRRGLPYPILWIAEYFTIDGEGLRWGRFYLQAGYFTHIMLWTALPLWWLTIILFNIVPRYGGYFSIGTGTVMLVGNIIFGSLRNPIELIFPFYYEGCRKGTSDHSDCVMRLHYDWCFWLCLATGICCVLIGIVVIIMDVLAPEHLLEFFNVDLTKDLEESYVNEETETEEERKRRARHRTVVATRSGGVGVAMRRQPAQGPSPGTSAGVDDIELQMCQPGSPQPETQLRGGFRKRTIAGLSRVQKTRKTQKPESFYPPEYEPAGNVNGGYADGRSASGAAADIEEDDDLYVNAQMNAGARVANA